jgi:hypothetical protein
MRKLNVTRTGCRPLASLVPCTPARCRVAEWSLRSGPLASSSSSRRMEFRKYVKSNSAGRDKPHVLAVRWTIRCQVSKISSLASPLSRH